MVPSELVSRVQPASQGSRAEPRTLNPELRTVRGSWVTLTGFLCLCYSAVKFTWPEGEASIPRDFRINEQIRVREVRLIGEDAEQLGIMPTIEALRVARERNLDLVEVAPTGTPPVCRLLDYGRFRYEQAKKERDARKNQHNIVVREVRFHPKIGVHDLEMKVKQAQRLLHEGDKVKVSVLFRGREMSHPELGRSLLARVANELKSYGILEKPVEMEGRNMNIILSPAAPRAIKADGKSSEPRDAKT